MRSADAPLDVTTEELEALLESVREALGETGYQKLKAAIRTLSYVTELLENRETTLQALRRLLCHARSEKTEAVLEQAGIQGSPTQRRPAAASKKPAAGHGRNGAQAYRGARRIAVPHLSLHQGDRCPECQRGKVYPLHDPGLLVRMQGQAPIAATVYELEKLRCNLCGEVFTAEVPAGVGEEKYDATAASMIALLRYGSGVPWNRLADLEQSLGIPLPVATQCEIVTETAAAVRPAMEELIRQAAQGEVLHNDDTSMPVLALREDGGMDHDERDTAERTGVFTSGIVSTAQKHTIALFFTGRQHAGENLADVLQWRAVGTGSAHADVRRAVAQPAQAAGEVGGHRGPLSGSCSASFCGGDAQLSRAVPACTGTTGRDLRQRCAWRGNQHDAGRAVALPPAA